MSRQSCIMCLQVPLDILVLQCNHSLCMKCASQICQLKSCCIMCPKCRNQTYLNQQLINQIQQCCVEFQAQQVRGKYIQSLQSGRKQNTQRNIQFSDYSSSAFNNNMRETLNKNKNKFNHKEKLNINYSTPSNNILSEINLFSNMNKTTNISKQLRQTNQKYRKPPKYKEFNQQLLTSMQNDSSTNNQIQRQPIQKINYKKNKHESSSFKRMQSVSDSCFSEFYAFNCKEHNQYEIMYICLECDNIFICPQCIIHGVHKNHQVQTIKKSVNKIQAQLSSKIYSLDCSIQGLVNASEDRKMKLKGRIDKINKLKQEAMAKYNSIREELAKQQAQIVQKCVGLIQIFERDFNQIQMWIKNDLLCIEKEKDLINNVLNPMTESNGNIKMKKISKSDQKLTQLKIVQQYFHNLKRNDKNHKKNYLWINNKQKQLQYFQPKSQQSLQNLTDRIQKIKLNYSPNNKFQAISINMNNMSAKHSALSGSRIKQYYDNVASSKLGSTMQNNKNRVSQSPFNLLKSAFEKQNLIAEAESILVKGSRNIDSIKVRKKSLKNQQQNNFLIF